MNVRNHLYDRGVFGTYDLGARTISVGNITTGGTGKTPLVAYIATILAESGETVCILTRGYGRRDPKKRVLVCNGEEILASQQDAGDEPFELATKLLGKAFIVADADRVSAGEWAKREFGVTRFVLDDGFQHRRAKRDVDIVCIDATNPFGGDQMLPAGRLREPVENLSRATAIVITRADLVDDVSALRSKLAELAPEAKIFSATSKTRVVDPETGAAADATGRKIFAFCGLGNPDGFFRLVKRNGLELIGSKTFRDHHVYTRSDIAEIEKKAANAGANILLTTAKDAVKLTEFSFEMPCCVLEIEVELDDPEAFAGML